MSYEIRKIENSKHICPSCSGRNTTKYAHDKKKRQKRKCNDCGYNYTEELYEK